LGVSNDSLSLPFVMMSHKMFSKNESVRPAEISANSPRSGGEIQRLCEEKIRELLGDRGLASLQPSNPKVLKLAPLRSPVGFEEPPNNGRVRTSAMQPVIQAAAERQLSRWSVTFDLTHKSIPLERSSCVSILVRGDMMLIDWRNVPEKDRLPRDEELVVNVLPERAVQVANADFRSLMAGRPRDAGEGNEPAIDPELRGGGPAKELWFGPDKVGRLVWTFTIGARSRKDSPATDVAARYWVQARAQGGMPKVLARSRPSSPAFDGTVTGWVWKANADPRKPRVALTQVPLSHLMVHSTGKVRRGETTPMGQYNCPGAFDESLIGLRGPICSVLDDSRNDRGTLRPQFTHPIIPAINVLGGPLSSFAPQIVLKPPIDFDFATRLPEETAQVTAFYWVTSGFDFYNSHLPTAAGQLKALLEAKPGPGDDETIIKIHVNSNRVPQYDWIHRKLYLSKDMSKTQGEKYAEMNGSCRDVILHEFAHAIHFTGNQPRGGTKEGDPSIPVLKENLFDEWRRAESYSEGFADAFVILHTKNRGVGEGLRAGGGPVRDYINPLCTVNVDGKEHKIRLAYGDSSRWDDFRAQYGDTATYFAGRVYAHFVCDLIDRFRLRKTEEAAQDAVARLVFMTDATDPANIPTAVYEMLSLADDADQQDIRIVAKQRDILRYLPASAASELKP
ncbi:MAG: hypothetical protein ACLQGP_06265, partial [Isosphaeraceae bacterium]